MNAELIKYLIAKQKLTIDSLAEKIEVHPSTVYNMLAGKRVRTRTVFKLAKALRVEVSQIAPHLKNTVDTVKRFSGLR